MTLIWKSNGVELDSVLVFPVGFPAVSGTTQAVTVSSSARPDGTFATLKNVSFFLAGDPAQLNTVLTVWPNYGSTVSPARPDLNGGIEISWDNGLTFQRLGLDPVSGVRAGFQDDPTTWIPLPAEAVTPGAVAGQIGPLDLVTINIRYNIPPLADQFQVFNLRLEAAFDVI